MVAAVEGHGGLKRVVGNRQSERRVCRMFNAAFDTLPSPLRHALPGCRRPASGGGWMGHSTPVRSLHGQPRLDASLPIHQTDTDLILRQCRAIVVDKFLPMLDKAMNGQGTLG